MCHRLVAKAAPLQECAKPVAERGVIHIGMMRERTGLFATGAQCEFLILILVYQLIDDIALDAFHAQLIFERARAAWIELIAILHPELDEGAIIDKVEAVQAGQRRLDDIGGRFFALQVAAHLFAAARAKREEVQRAINGLLLRLLAAQLLQLLRQQFLPDMQLHTHYYSSVDAQQVTAINIHIESLSIINLWFKIGYLHGDTISCLSILDNPFKFSGWPSFFSGEVPGQPQGSPLLYTYLTPTSDSWWNQTHAFPGQGVCALLQTGISCADDG